MCHVSHVTCHMSHVTIFFVCFFLHKVVKLIGGGSVINGAYPIKFSHKSSYILGCICHVCGNSIRMKFYIKNIRKKAPFFLVPGSRPQHFGHILQKPKPQLMASLSSNHSLDLYLPKSLGPWSLC